MMNIRASKSQQKNQQIQMKIVALEAKILSICKKTKCYFDRNEDSDDEDEYEDEFDPPKVSVLYLKSNNRLKNQFK